MLGRRVAVKMHITIIMHIDISYLLAMGLLWRGEEEQILTLLFQGIMAEMQKYFSNQRCSLKLSDVYNYIIYQPL